MRVPTWLYILICAGLIVGNVNVYRAIFAEPVLTVTVLSVGPADKAGHAVLLRSPSGKTVLVDTGPDASILRALGSTLPLWKRRLDAAILTSTKKAFTGGLPDAPSRFRVARSFSTGTSFSLGAVSIAILAPATLAISYGFSVFNISSSTPAGGYVSDGTSIVPKI